MRVRSLDVFRGLTMAAMVVVNNPGDWGAVYAPLLHADWHGWTPTDLIFPWFLFIMGAAVALAGPGRASWGAVARRAGALIGLGLLLAGYPHFDPARWRIPGVLFRLGICYAGAAAVWKIAAAGEWRRSVATTAAVVAAALLGYWALLALVAPPGGVAGDLTPDGNLGAWVDRAVFGRHLWKTTWDPEGLLSSIPAIGTTLCGAMAGAWMRERRPGGAAAGLLAAGGAAIATGLAWDVVFPINKSLWTSSYAIFTAGTACVVMGLLHLALDGSRRAPWLDRASEPLVALGRNALLLFVVSGLVAKTLLVWQVGAAGSAQQWIFSRGFAPWAAPRNASLAYAVTNLAVLYGLLAWLHGRRWYWSV